MNDNLIRQMDEKFQPDHVVIVGNGAISNGWELVQKTITTYPILNAASGKNALFTDSKYTEYVLAT